MALFLGSALNLHGRTQLSRVFGPRISREFQALACQTCSGTFCNGLDIADVGSIRLACFCDVTSSIFFNATAYLSDLAIVDIDIAVSAKGDLSTGGYILAVNLSRRLIADGRDALQVFCQLDFQLAAVAVDADVLVSQVLAVCTADDIESVVQLLGNNRTIIALEFQAIFHGSYLMFTSTIFVDDTCQACTIDAFFTFDTILAICSSFSIITILDGDIDGSSRLSICTLYAIGASRACQADMAFRAILAIDSFHGHTILTIFTFDGDTVFAVNTNTGLAVPAVDADAAGSAGSTIFAILAVYSKFFHGHILIHEDGDVAIFINFRGQVVSRVFMPLFLGSALNLHCATQLSRIFGPRISREFQAIICIGFDLCIESTQVLASRIVGINIIRRTGWLIIVVQCLACYQLVGSRSICGSSGRAFRELFCAKSLAPVIFIGFLLVFCCIGFCNGFSIIADGVGLQISANVRCVRFSIRFQLFHDHGIMSINAVSGFDETIVVSRLIRCIFCSNRILSVIVPRPICIG